ncbi:MAG: lysine exporter LysO family protein [Psychrobium sp.]|nr:lysine exporter LysO family protein [Psychrobium sp.]
MYLGILLILLPLFLGYFVVIKSEKWLHIINSGCSYMVYVILFLMGISLSLLDNLANNALIIFGYSALFIIAIVSANILGLLYFDRKNNQRQQQEKMETIAKLPLILESLQLLGLVCLGFVLGYFTSHYIVIEKSIIDTVSEWALMGLLALIGCQLRNSGIAMREILLNKQGMLIAVVVMITSWLAGILVSLYLSMPLNHGLAIASGFGWYSLSGILISDGISPVLGGVAFICDLARELIAILLIPLLIKKYRLSAIGVGGATSMDFTLPIIQRSGGSAAVPLAIVSGFILTLAAPLFIIMFINISA